MRIHTTTTLVETGEVLPSSVYDTEKRPYPHFVRSIEEFLALSNIRSITITWDDGDTTVYQEAKA